MFFLLLFFSELLVLFFLSRQVTRGLSYLIYRITRSERITIYLMALLFFPGTLVHELSHYLTAAVLFVRVGRMEFVPKIMGGSVKMGSVEIGGTDPLRRAFIGMAPFFWGTAIILLLLTAFLQFGGLENITVTLLTGYVLFEISNTMFSSRKDMEGTLELFLAGFIVLVIFYFLGFRFPNVNLDSVLTPESINLFQIGSYFLAAPLAIDIVLVALLRLLRSIPH